MKNLNWNTFRPLALTMMLLMMASLMVAQDREKIDVSNFNALSVSSAFVIEISVGSTESLEIEIEDRYRDDLIAEVRRGTLVIGLESSSRNRRMRESPRAYLTVKSLDKINVSGAVNLRTLDILKGDRLDVELSGASVAKMEVEVRELYVGASGACVINMEGSAREQTLKTSGATVYRAYDLESERANIRVSGAGSANVSVSERLDARASGASSIRYKGDPDVNKDTSGASSVRRG